MATASVKTADVRCCKICDQVVRVQSPSGRIQDVDSNQLRTASVALHRVLTRHPVGTETVVTLTYDQMRTLMTCLVRSAVDHPTEARATREIALVADGDSRSLQPDIDVVQDLRLNGRKGGSAASETKGTVVNTNKTVARRTEQRTGGYGVDAAERRISQLQQVVKKVSKQMYALTYRIPTELDEDCPNPSGLLWHHGFRIDWSGWVLTEDSVNSKTVQNLLAHWRKYPTVEFHLIRYHPDDCEMIRQIARDKLALEIMRVHTSLIERIGAAHDRLTQAQAQLTEREKQEGPDAITRREAERPQNLYDQTARDSIRTAMEALDAAVSCARYFDETESVEKLLEGLRAAIRSETSSFNALAQQRGRKLIPEL